MFALKQWDQMSFCSSIAWLSPTTKKHGYRQDQKNIKFQVSHTLLKTWRKKP